jgi:hypothetical protein
MGFVRLILNTFTPRPQRVDISITPLLWYDSINALHGKTDGERKPENCQDSAEN